MPGAADDYLVTIEERPDRDPSFRWRWNIIDKVKRDKKEFGLGDGLGGIEAGYGRWKFLAERRAEKALRKHLQEIPEPQRYEWSGSEFMDHRHPREYG